MKKAERGDASHPIVATLLVRAVESRVLLVETESEAIAVLVISLKMRKMGGKHVLPDVLDIL